MNDVFVRYSEELPYGVRGMVMRDEDGNYNIYINPHLSSEEQDKAVKHEMAHIENGDFDNNLNIEQTEERAKRK